MSRQLTQREREHVVQCLMIFHAFVLRRLCVFCLVPTLCALGLYLYTGEYVWGILCGVGSFLILFNLGGFIVLHRFAMDPDKAASNYVDYMKRGSRNVKRFKKWAKELYPDTIVDVEMQR